MVAEVSRRDPDELSKKPFMEWCDIAEAALSRQKEKVDRQKKHKRGKRK